MNANSAIQTARRGTAGFLFYVLMILIGTVFVLGPLIGPVFTSKLALTGGARVVLVSFGAVVLAIGCILTVITKLYHKADSDMALVRTGMGGSKAIVDGGSIVVPFAHNLIVVSLMTMKLSVERRGKDSLLTKDKLRADVVSEFYIRVQKDEKAVKAAATSLGTRCTDPDEISKLMYEKLVSALRSVAATMTLGELNSNREDFARKVQEIVTKELEPNGLTLEAVTVSHLDQTPPNDMRGTENVFDSEGLRTIAEITQKNTFETRQIQLETQRKLKEKEVENAKFLAEQDVVQASAVAEANAKTAAAQAEAELKANNARAKSAAEAEKFKAEQAQLSGRAAAESDQVVRLAQVATDQKVKLAEVERDQQVQVNRVKSEQAKAQAEIEKAQAVEVKTREQQIAVAEKETLRAQAEAAQLLAQRERESAAQAVTTTNAVAEAERTKQTTVIAQQAKAEQTKIEQQIAADVAAYQVTKKAEGESIASLKQAEAILKLAEANKQASVLQAEGHRAEGLVPVQVAEAQVEVDAKKVQVLKTELEAKSANEKAAVQLQIALAEIAADKDARVAFATAAGSAFANAKMQIFGDPETLKSMLSAFATGQQHGKYVSALVENTPEKVTELVTTMAQALATRLGGKTANADEIAAVLKDVLPLGKR